MIEYQTASLIDIYSYLLVLALIVVLLIKKRYKEVFIGIPVMVIIGTILQLTIVDPRPCASIVGSYCYSSYGMPSIEAGILAITVLASELDIAFICISLLLLVLRVTIMLHSIPQILLGILFGSLIFLLLSFKNSKKKRKV